MAVCSEKERERQREEKWHTLRSVALQNRRLSNQSIPQSLLDDDPVPRPAFNAMQDAQDLDDARFEEMDEEMGVGMGSQYEGEQDHDGPHGLQSALGGGGGPALGSPGIMDPRQGPYGVGHDAPEHHDDHGDLVSSASLLTPFLSLYGALTLLDIATAARRSLPRDVTASRWYDAAAARPPQECHPDRPVDPERTAGSQIVCPRSLERPLETSSLTWSAAKQTRRRTADWGAPTRRSGTRHLWLMEEIQVYPPMLHSPSTMRDTPCSFVHVDDQACASLYTPLFSTRLVTEVPSCASPPNSALAVVSHAHRLSCPGAIPASVQD